jgi:hypothetical protein
MTKSFYLECRSFFLPGMPRQNISLVGIELGGGTLPANFPHGNNTRLGCSFLPACNAASSFPSWTVSMVTELHLQCLVNIFLLITTLGMAASFYLEFCVEISLWAIKA